MAGSGVTVHIGYPPDMDTPGFANEAATMVTTCRWLPVALHLSSTIARSCVCRSDMTMSPVHCSRLKDGRSRTLEDRQCFLPQRWRPLNVRLCCTIRLSHLCGSLTASPLVMQVAQCFLKGLRRGDYHLPGPDFGLNLLVAPMAGYSPRMYNGLVECLLAPVMLLISLVGVPVIDSVVKKVRAW